MTQSGSEAIASFYAGTDRDDRAGLVPGREHRQGRAGGLRLGGPAAAGRPRGPQQAANPQTLSVNIDSEHVEESAEFIEFFTQTENLAALNEADALIPATTSAQEAMTDKLGDENGWSTILAGGQNFVSAPYLFADSYAQWKDTVATPAYQRYLAQEIDATELSGPADDGWDEITSDRLVVGAIVAPERAGFATITPTTKPRCAERRRRSVTVSWLDDRVVAVITGAAVGDALGGATEGWTPEQIEERHGGPGDRHRRALVPPNWRDARPIAPYHKGDGHITDDTLMTQALVEVYAKRRDAPRRVRDGRATWSRS